MPRRRLTFRAYAKRRWRAVGLIAVLLAGTLLVLTIIDRGHDPVWDARGGGIEEVAVSPDGSAVYDLVRENGNITRLEARRGTDGRVVWESPLSATRALLAAGSSGVAIATDFPFAFLTHYDAGGGIQFQVPLEGNPRALAVEGDLIALALQAPGNPVLLFESGSLVRTHRFASFVNAVDLASGHVAAGTGGGEVVVLDPDGQARFNASFSLSVRSLQLSRDGTSFVVGGFSLVPGDLSGAVAFVDTIDPRPVRWTRTTTLGVGLVDLDDAGLHALAVEESPPRYRLRLFETGTGDERWSRELPGYVARDDSGARGGAALSPDGRAVVASTLRSALEAYSVQDGHRLWGFASEGSTIVTFAPERPDVVVANARLLQNGPYEAVLLFSVGGEPLSGRLPLLAVAATLLAAAMASLIVGVGYWRARRSY